MSRTLARFAVATLLVLAATACSSDDDKSKDKDTAAKKSTVEKPVAEGGCSTELQVGFTVDGERQNAELIYPAAVATGKASGLTLFASDKKLDLDALPDSPRADDKATFLTLEVSPVGGRKKVAPIEQSTRVKVGGKAKSDYRVTVNLARGDASPDVDHSDVDAQLVFVEKGPKSGDGLCVRIRYTDSVQSVRGTFYAPLMVATKG